MHINLLTLPVYVTGAEHETDRWNNILPWLQENGFRNVQPLFTRDFRAEHGFMSSTMAYLSAIENLQTPFLLLENDCCFTGHFISELRLDPQCVAFYLGLSVWGQQGRASVPGASRLFRHPGYPRVVNMYGSHAIVYLDPNFLDVYRAAAGVHEPCDVTLAAMQQRFLMQALNPPMFYQRDGHNEAATNVTLEVVEPEQTAE